MNPRKSKTGARSEFVHNSSEVWSNSTLSPTQTDEEIIEKVLKKSYGKVFSKESGTLELSNILNCMDKARASEREKFREDLKTEFLNGNIKLELWNREKGWSEKRIDEYLDVFLPLNNLKNREEI